jgi:DNA-directed RNA polymerase subunit H (RpoH/RPB5)
MSFTNTDLISIYNSRKTLLDVFRETNETSNTLYNLSSYENFNINEIEAMTKNNQLDMLLTHDKERAVGHSIYVKYLLSKTAIRLPTIDDLVEELFEIEGILTKEDTLVIVVNDEPNDSMIAKLRYLFDNRGYYVVVHNIKRLQRNILKHVLVPAHTVLNDVKILGINSEGSEDKEELSELDVLKRKYNLKNFNQLPEISRFDPVALLIELRPGQVCKIDRKSVTSVDSEYYRICV